MKLNKPIKLTLSQYNDLDFIKNSLLLRNTHSNIVYMYLADFKVEKVTEEKTVKRLFKKDEVVKNEKLLLTEINFLIWKEEYGAWYILTDEAIKTILNFFDVKIWKNNYNKTITAIEQSKEELKKLKYEIK
jgi:hypothetical protein